MQVPTVFLQIDEILTVRKSLVPKDDNNGFDHLNKYLYHVISCFIL